MGLDIGVRKCQRERVRDVFVAISDDYAGYSPATADDY